MPQSIPRIAVTSGEPAGIGPDLVLSLARNDWPAELTIFGSRAVLAERARLLGLDVQLVAAEDSGSLEAARRGRLRIADIPTAVPVRAGQLEAANGAYVLAMLHAAGAACLSNRFDALVTAPVHKGVINDGGTPFSGHTEFFAELTGSDQPVMLLVAGSLRVALATTHLALKDVPAAITRDGVTATLKVLDADLRRRFGLKRPHIVVLGLNPHAGESGHLGREELDVIIPAVEALRRQGLNLHGPLPADTAFIERNLAGVDAVLAMYHDQGLPVLKHKGFGHAVNVTLGLPIIRTSVDHGTALDLAGTGQAEDGSLRAALELAIAMATSSAATVG